MIIHRKMQYFSDDFRHTRIIICRDGVLSVSPVVVQYGRDLVEAEAREFDTLKLKNVKNI